jgi:hypothetical protein
LLHDLSCTEESTPLTRPLKYDRWSFYEHGRFLKNAEGKAEDRPNSLAYSDMSGLHIMAGAERQPERRLPTPRWALEDKLLRVVLVHYLEERFYTTRHRQGTLLERLAQCKKAAERYLPGTRETLAAWIKDYRTLSSGRFQELNDEDAQQKFASLKENDGQRALTGEIAREMLASKKLRDLETQIMNLDTDIFLTEKGHAEMVNAIVYKYYRLAWNSVSIAEDLGLKPPHIRQVLFRLNLTADALSQNNEEFGTVKIQAQDGSLPGAELNDKAADNYSRGGQPQSNPLFELYGVPNGA